MRCTNWSLKYIATATPMSGSDVSRYTVANMRRLAGAACRARSATIAAITPPAVRASKVGAPNPIGPPTKTAPIHPLARALNPTQQIVVARLRMSAG